MKTVLLGLIQFYTWIGDLIRKPGQRWKDAKKLEELRRKDPFNYTTF